MNKTIFTHTLIGLNHSCAQVGIGSSDPNTTSQLVGDPASTITADGMQGPSLSLAQLDAKEDQSTGVRWYACSYGNTQAKGDGLYAGKANTSINTDAHVAIGDDGSTHAARICNELQITEGGFSLWRLVFTLSIDKRVDRH
jgi:hypothetical protein